MKKILVFVILFLCFVYPFSFSLAEISMDKEGDGGVREDVIEEKTTNIEEDQEPMIDSSNNDSLNLASKARSAIIIESSTGKVIYSKNANERLAMASMTNIMTT